MLLKLKFKPTEGKKPVDKIFLDYLLKSLSLLFLVWCIVGTFFYDSFIGVINGGWYDGVYRIKTDFTHSLILWGYNIASVALLMAMFFKSRLFKNISVFFCLPFSIAAATNFDRFMFYYTEPGGKGIVLPTGFREFYLAFELILAIALPLILVFCELHYLRVNDKKEVLAFVFALPAVILRLCPVSVPQSLFGFTNITYSMFSPGNIFWVLMLAVEIVVLYRVFRFRSYRDRYMLCMFLALVSLVGVSSMFMMGFDPKRLPLQINSLCAYLLIIALLIKNDKFFNFVFLTSVTGAVIAIVTATTEGDGAASFWAYRFFIEHTTLLVIPLMCSILRLFPRVNNPKALLHLTIGMGIYFGVLLIVGTLINGLTNSRVNYMFLFEFASIRDIINLPSVLFVRVKIGSLSFYPIIQIIICVFVWLLCVLVYFGMQKIYAYLDDQFELREARINLTERITNKKSNELREYPD